MRQKLRSSQGETLVEVLASILICALSIALLFGSVMASGHIDRTAQETDKQYYLDLTKAERQEEDPVKTPDNIADTFTPASATSVTVTLKDPPPAPGASAEVDTLSSPADLTFYGTERLLSYAAVSGTGGGP